MPRAPYLEFAAPLSAAAVGACQFQKLELKVLDDGDIKETTLDKDLEVEVSATSEPADLVTIYSDAKCETAATSLTMAAGTSELNVFYKFSSAGTGKLNAVYGEMPPVEGIEIEGVSL